MTVSTTNRKNTYTGNGVAVEFPYTFKLIKTSEIRIIKTNIATQIEERILSNFNVTNSEIGGIVKYPADDNPLLILGSDYKITIYREVENTQEEISLSRLTTFNSENIETAIDRLTMRDQEIQEEIGRCVKSAISSTAPTSYYLDEILKAYYDISLMYTVQTINCSSSTQEIDISKGNIIILNLSVVSDVTLSFINISHPCNIRLTVFRSGLSEGAINFPSTYLFSNAIPLTTSAGINVKDVFQIWSNDENYIYVNKIGENYKVV